MSLMKSLVIFSSSSTSLIVRGAPPGPGPEPDTFGGAVFPAGLLNDETAVIFGAAGEGGAKLC